MRLIVILSSILFSLSCLADVTVSRVVSVYDGDTFRVDIDEWPGIVGRNMPVRIAGIDTPERRSKCSKEKILAYKARQKLAAILRQGDVVLKNIRRGKYFRLLSDVFVNGKSVADLMIQSGYAVRYDGGRKPPNACATSASE